MKWPERKVLACVHKGDLAWTFNLKAPSIEQARQVAIDRTEHVHPEILRAKGELIIEFIYYS